MTKAEVLTLPAKKCTRCGKLKERLEFSIRIRNGLAHSHSECRSCANLIKRHWYANNKDYARAHARNYHWVNRDIVLEKKTKFNSTHREQLRQEAKNRYWANPEVFRARRKEYTKQNKEEQNRRQRANRLEKNYGLSEQVYMFKLEKQQGLCAICMQPETRQTKGVLCRLSVDHDHYTGRIRDLLCSNCNLAVGYVKENPDTADKLADYLRYWNCI